MQCQCEAAGYCPLLKRPMSEHHFAICQHQVLTPAKCEVYQRNWLQLAGVPIDPDACPHRGEQVRTETCHVCGRRGQQVPIHQCDVFGECSPKLHQIGQVEHVCDGCTAKPKIPRAVWDRQVTNLIPAADGQNFNCSLIDFQGRKLFAYRHGWGGARIGLCELDGNWQPKWNTLLQFQREEHNVYQEDPRLFLFRGELHVAFTAVQTQPRTVAHVGYAKLQEVAPGAWRVADCYLPEYDRRQAWEKNWGFFEADGQLWAIYDAGQHTVLSIVGGRAKLAYQHAGPTIPGTRSHGDTRGGASPQFWRGDFYSFVHFKVPNVKRYAGGLYTFDAMPPFAPKAYLPYPLLHPNPEHCTQPCASQVVYPCGAALLDWRWVISYGAYDKDSRVAAYDVNDVKNAMQRRKQ
jgi:hypothetical protein